MRRLICLLLVVFAVPVLSADRPNVIFIITDDQGYGDVGAHGNEILKTPNLDKLHSESIRLTDYHVDPTCSPTRSALMTGRYSTRVGVWHTINGRSMLPGDELTLAEVFKANGYRTGMFGKWHLGDNAPCRPMDQGFEHVVWHKGGGVGQGPDYFGNDYFGDTYEVNGKRQKFEGYCTDIWFNEAMKYVGDVKDKDEPFFIYLATNAPHGPFLVDEKYSKPYADLGVPGSSAPFYGMIANIDENLGRLRHYLNEQGLADNTLLIYTTDNGTARGNFQSKEKKGIKGFNAGMRAQKGSQYDGGHRVPFFMHWPKGGVSEGKDIQALCAHIDVLPTFVDLLKLKKPKGEPMDGLSLKGVIQGDEDSLPERTIVTATQRQFIPPKWEKSAAMQGKWRLIDGKALYDIRKDPGQEVDLADQRPEMVAILRQEYEAWWREMQPSFEKIVRYDLGGAENPTTLMSHDWLVEKGSAPWNQPAVKQNKLMNGPFMLNVKKAGKYRITPMRWPEYVDKPSGVVRADVEVKYGTRGLLGQSSSWNTDPTKPIKEVNHQSTFNLPVGPAKLTSTLTREDGKEFGAYYVEIEYLGEE
ncbi:MAG: arylsulfatase [Phycisphaeraceae bacterium]|nr:arylsulfatase [Phycisphaeraceae bacterium]